MKNISLLFRFCLVGSTGTIINITAYYMFTNFLGFGINHSSIYAFFIAVSSNYVLNHYWTFLHKTKGKALTIKKFFQYVSANLIGLSVNLVVLNLFINIFGIDFHVLAQLLGVLSGTVFNFIFSKKIVFLN